MTRHPGKMKESVGGSTEVAFGDVLDPESLREALAGVDQAYYLVHSMDGDGSFVEKDRIGARNFGRAAREAGVRRIIYLGGLGHDDQALSPHLRSRHEVGEILRESGVPVVEFRASIIIGAGSLSFEMIRALVERLPLMLTPRWVSVTAQPIAIGDVLAYLGEALDLDDEGSRIFEIGGAERVSYAEIMRAYGRCRGIRVRMLPVPVLTPYLSSLWLGLVTPLYARIGRKLIESIVHSTVVRDESALEEFGVRPIGVEEAICRALEEEDREFDEARWHELFPADRETAARGQMRFNMRYVDSRTRTVPVAREAAFEPIRRIGGSQGWYAWNGLWRLRGWIDRLFGGEGLRRGRPHPETLSEGDRLDFWRVEVYERGRRLRLAAEMRLPGRAWLEFEVTEHPDGATIRQTAIFDPLGFLGRLYWYAVYPLHQIVFSGMLDGIVRAAVERSAAAPRPAS